MPPAPSQIARLKRFDCECAVDVHCHILPGVDDGPREPADAVALARMLVADGFTDVIATPHQLGRWDGVNESAAIRDAVAETQSLLDKNEIPLRIHVGGEVRLDERIPMLLAKDRVLSLADRGKLLMLELPSSLSIDPAMLIPFMAGSDVRIVLAHAERYDSIANQPAVAEKWVQAGVALQVNAASLLGDSGEYAENAAWEWLSRGWVSLVGSDAHSVNSRRPKMSEAIDEMIDRVGMEATRRVCIENPARVLRGADLI